MASRAERSQNRESPPWRYCTFQPETVIWPQVGPRLVLTTSLTAERLPGEIHDLSAFKATSFAEAKTVVTQRRKTISPGTLFGAFVSNARKKK